jgi:hypothetical protein
MRQDSWTTIERWLQAGAHDVSSPELEAAWSRLFQELPDESPSAAFPGLVMARVASLAHPRLGRGGLRQPARDLSPRLRLALVACLVTMGVSALVLPVLLIAFPLPVGGVIDALAVAVKAGAAWTAQVIAVWGFLAGVAQTVSVVLATPEAAAFLVGFALLSAAALRLLFELTRKDRRIADAAAR